MLRFCESDTHSVETVLQVVSFDLFSGQRCAYDPPVALDSGSEPQLLVRLAVGESRTHSHSTV